MAEEVITRESVFWRRLQEAYVRQVSRLLLFLLLLCCL